MFVCVYWTKQLTPPTVSPCISVKLKSHDFAKWVKILLRIILQRSLVFNQRRLLRERRLARVQDGRFWWRWHRQTTVHWALHIFGHFVVLCSNQNLAFCSHTKQDRTVNGAPSQIQKGNILPMSHQPKSHPRGMAQGREWKAHYIECINRSI